MLLLLTLGLTLLWRFLEWYNVRIDVLSRGTGVRAPAPTTPVASAPAATPMPPASPRPPAAPDENQPALMKAGDGAAFLIGRNLYATSESLTDGYGHIYPLRFPGALTSGQVVVHDRAGSGIALFSTDTDFMPSVAPMVLASAASLRAGDRVRALDPLPSMFIGPARPAPGGFGGVRLEKTLVLLETALDGPVTGAPILDDAGRVVGIVVRRREQEKNLFMAADQIAELVRRARQPR